MERESTTKDKILEKVNERNIKTVEELLLTIEMELGISKDIALKLVVDLQNEGKLKLTQPVKEVPKGFFNYIRSTHATWFWITIILVIATTITVFTIQEDALPLVYIRNILGILFILFLPGYSLIKTLFPKHEINIKERIAFSIGTSIAIIPLMGILLNNSPWGMRLTPITLSILFLTIILAISGVIREHQEKKRV